MLTRRAGFHGLDPFERLLQRGCSKRRDAGEQLVQHHAQAEDVGPAVHEMSFAPGLLGAHVLRGPHVAGELAEICLAEGEAEISQVRPARAVEQNVRRFDVAVHQAMDVCVMQGFGDGCYQRDRLIPWYGARPQPRSQVGSFDQLRHDIAVAFGGPADVVDRHDARVVQRGEDARLGEEVVHAGDGGDVGPPGHLDRHLAIEILIDGQVDAPEAARSQRADDPIPPDDRRWWWLLGRGTAVWSRTVDANRDASRPFPAAARRSPSAQSNRVFPATRRSAGRAECQPWPGRRAD